MENFHLSDSWIFRQKQVLTLEVCLLSSVLHVLIKRIWWKAFYFERLKKTEAYSEPCQTSTMEHLTKLIQWLSVKLPILDV